MQSSKNNKPVKKKAGVVAYRYRNEGEAEILLITARSYPESWIFPVGTVKSAETLPEAAARECVEESGYVVDVGSILEVVEMDRGDSIHRFTFFLAYVIGEVENYEIDRQRQWVLPSEVVNKVTNVFSSVARAAIAAKPFAKD